MTADNPFVRFWSLGFKRLLPIIPPGSPISEHSTLFKRPKDVGKVPGVKGDDGKWRSFPWLKHTTTEDDLQRWHAMGAGVGIRTGATLVAVDIDTLEQDLADDIANTAYVVLGTTAMRVGRWPKRLLLYRTADPIPYQRVKFLGGLVELLSDDRQFVAHGIHPATGKPYEWPGGIPAYDSLPVVDAASIAKFFAAVADQMPAAEAVTVGALPVDRQGVDQAQLTGSERDVAAAVAAIPNTSELFPTYDDYIRVGLAIKGATQDDPDAGLALFQEWAAKWDGGNEPDRVEADWNRCKPPFALGAQYLYHLASKHGGFDPASTWFQGGTASASPFDMAPQEAAPTILPIRWIDPQQWSGEEPPPREWEVEGWIPRREVTLLYGEGGIGKTLAMHQYAVCAAAGVPWLGQKTRPARVTAVFCEDGEEELQRRHHAILKALKLDATALGGRFRMVSRTGEDNLLATLNRASGALAPTAFYRQLREDVADWRADVTIVDTIADTFGGSEIDRGQVNAFVKTILGGLVKVTGGSVVALGHPSVAGRAEGRSGSTAWSNAARSRMYLRYPKGQESGNVRELAGTKSNYGPRGALLKLKWSAGIFDVLAASAPEIDLNAFKDLGGTPTPDDLAETAVRAAWEAADDVPLSMRAAAAAYAPKVLRTAYPDGLQAVTDDELVAATRRLVATGYASVDAKGIVRRVTVASLEMGGVFS